MKEKREKIHKAMAEKYKLDTPYIHKDIGQDNSFFITDKVRGDLEKELENPGLMRKLVEKMSPKEKKVRLDMLSAIKGAKRGKDGLVILGTGERFGNRPEILAHELGHASNHKDRPWVYPSRNIGMIGGMVGAQIAHAAGRNKLAAALAAAGFVPTLADEAIASYKGYETMKEHGMNPSAKELVQGFSTYVAAPAMMSGIYLLRDKLK